MGGLTISNKMLDKYFGYLKYLDDKAKKSLILRHTKSMNKKPKNNFDLNDFFGAWEDDKDTDEIISEIKSSRIEKLNTESFE